MNQEKLNKLEQTIESDHSNIVGIVVRKAGNICFEKYFHEYTAQDAVHVFSVTKSVVSALVGIAIDQGIIRSVDQKVLEFFPKYTVPKGERTIQNITIKHLLTMTAPYKYETEPYELFFASQNPVWDALDFLGGDNPIGEFDYAAIGGTHILSGILVSAIGGSLLDFAVKYLFAPLGIQVTHSVELRDKEEHIAVMNDKNTSGWVVDPQGINTAGWGLFLMPADMAKIGQLYLNGGVWEGKRILSAEWVAESTREQSRCIPLNLSYGYLWWIIDGDSFGAMGDGGNVIYVNSKKKIVTALAALYVPEAGDRIELIKEHVEPVFED